MSPPPSAGNSIGPEWRPALPYRWGGHVSPQFVVFLLLLHGSALGWFCSDWNRVRLLLYDYVEVSSEEVLNEDPAELADALGFEEDAPEELTRFREIATPLVDGATDATMRARRLADYIYSLRQPGIGNFDEDVRFGPGVLLDRLHEGYHANCGQMSTVLATFWRSLGAHSRAVRWGQSNGTIGHYAVELWDPDRERWFYYDMNLNGYGVDDDGSTPLSIAALRSSLLTEEDLHLVSNAEARDFTPANLVGTVRDHPIEWYVLNNTFLDWSPERRFGILNRFRDLLTRLPHPLDRLVDNLTGGRDRRLMVEGRLHVAGLFTLRGARIFVLILLGVSALCVVTLWRMNRGIRSSRTGSLPPE